MLGRLAIVIIFLFSACALQAKPLEYRIWQFHDYNMPHIKRLIDMAAEQHVNRIQLSHNIVMDVEEVLYQPKRVKDINIICRWAHEKGIKVDMWTHELNGIPEELREGKKAKLDDPKLWEFVRGKYEKLFELCPELDGLVLTMHETALSIYHDTAVESSVAPEDRVAQLIDKMAKVCNSLGKTFFVRTFSYEPDELKYIQEGLRRSKADIIVMTKCQPHDWQPYYPHNPAIGDVGDHPQIVEFDLGYEFTSNSTIPYIDLDYLENRLDYAMTKPNVVGAVLRIERLKWRAVDTPNQANIDVFTKLLLSPTTDSQKLYKNWLADKYGEKAMPYLYSAFVRTDDIVNKSYYALGFWCTTNHSLIGSYREVHDLLPWVTTAKWSPTPYWKALEQELKNPTPATIRKLQAEKDEALELVNASIADLKKAKPFLSSCDYDYLMDLFQREKAMVKVWKAHTEVVFGIDVYKRTKAHSDKRFLVAAIDRLEKLTRENERHLINMAADYSEPQNRHNIKVIDNLLEYARAVVAGEPDPQEKTLW